MEERAFIYHLIARRFPLLKENGSFESFCRGHAGDAGWTWALGRSENINQIRTLQDRFFDEIQRDKELNIPVVESEALARAIGNAIERRKTTSLLGRLRNALVLAALDEIRPDLVILDEFQKFRDLLIDKPGQNPDDVALALRGGEGANRTGVLLLSATPYHQYVTRKQESQGLKPRSEFIELISFLFGERSRQPAAIQDELDEFRKEMVSPSPNTVRLEELKATLERRLRPVMSRTERPHVLNAKRRADIVATVGTEDLRVFTNWVERLRQSTQSEAQCRRLNLTSFAVPYWFSIPLPAQMMGENYVAWRHADKGHQPGEPVLRQKDRNRLRAPSNWPHPQVRATNLLLPPRLLSRPWITPSLPWWKLGGLWEDQADNMSGEVGPAPAEGKILIFSRFKAVPPALSSLLSFGLEGHLASQLGNSYERAGDSKPLQLKESSRGLLALFYPSPVLIRYTTPLVGSGASLGEIRKTIYAQLRGLLRWLEVPIKRSSRARPIWHLLAALEGTCDRAEDTGSNTSEGIRWKWGEAAGKAPGQREIMRNIIRHWEKAADTGLEDITEGELARLSEYALSSPGVVLGRAIYRHNEHILDADSYGELLELSWNGLRTYLNRSWFKAALTKRGGHYQRAILDAVVDGNLESVIDEHLWISSRLDGEGVSNFPKELCKALNLVSGRQLVSEPGREDFTLRCHAAMPFSDAKMPSDSKGGKGQVQRLRTDELRRSFNSPFWPHVLATTSLGQEGLDFHVWCRNILHWDLAHSPIDLEQREGRIQRYGGLSTRGMIAKRFGEKVLGRDLAGRSPWNLLAGLAEEASIGDSSGLSPWWGSDGEAIESNIVKLQHSNHVLRYKELSQQRLYYRLALGQPHQQDFIESITRLPPDGREKYALSLSAWHP